MFFRFAKPRPASFELVSRTGKRYRVTLPPPTPGLRSGFVFAYWKSGSTLLDEMLADYCKLTKTAYFSLFGQAFAQGITTSDIAEDARGCFPTEGYVFGGFRHFPEFDLPIQPDQQVILLVRDPRDMLVSLYFSVLKSHVIPEGNQHLAGARERSAQMSIDTFVMKQVPSYLRSLHRYAEQLERATVRVFRYEDVIFRKREWLGEVVDYLGLKHVDRHIARVAGQHDLLPESEDPTKHVRRVRPGDHADKLDRETIERLNDALAPFLHAYGYE